MAKNLTDSEVESKIAQLKTSQAVKLAQKERSLQMRRRKYLYDLQWLERRGNELAAAGINFDNIESVLFGEEE
mgnify:CR=1 FL=1